MPNAKITYVQNVTNATVNTILLGNLFEGGTTVISTTLTSLEILWSPGEGRFVGTSDIYENSTIEVYADAVILMKREHVVKVIPELSPISMDTNLMQQGTAGLQGVSSATSVEMGSPFVCVEPLFLNLTHCSGGSIQDYVIQARRSVDPGADGSVRNGPWYTIAKALGRPDRVAGPLGIEVLPSNLTGFLPSTTTGTECMYRQLSAVGLPSLSAYSLQWSDIDGTTYVYEPGSCINPVEVISPAPQDFLSHLGLPLVMRTCDR